MKRKRKNRIQPGAVIEPQELVTIDSDRIPIPARQGLVHLQFRRFASCPVCNLHLHSIVQRYSEIQAASIQEIVIFHSAQEAILPHASNLPFAIIADPDKTLYRAFGVESSPSALLDPRAWLPILHGIYRSLGAIARGEQPVPTLNPQGGRLSLPADFLIAADGRVLACKYGSHAYDQWSVNEILALATASTHSHGDLPATSGERLIHAMERNRNYGRP